MTTQTEKLTKKQTERLIGVNDLHELGTKVERHSGRLAIEKMATRLIPMEGGNAFYAYSVKITDTETGDFWMTATAKDAHEFIDGIMEVDMRERRILGSPVEWRLTAKRLADTPTLAARCLIEARACEWRLIAYDRARHAPIA